MTVFEAVMFALGLTVLILAVCTPLGFLIGWSLDRRYEAKRTGTRRCAVVNCKTFPDAAWSLCAEHLAQIETEVERDAHEAMATFAGSIPWCLDCGYIGGDHYGYCPKRADRCTCADPLPEGATPSPCTLHGWMGTPTNHTNGSQDV